MNANDVPSYILTVRAALDRFNVLRAPVTMARAEGDSRAEGWQYATARMNLDGSLAWKAPGAKAWRPVTGAEDGPHAKPLRMLLRLMAGEVKMTDREMQAASLTLFRSIACRECGKELTTPDSIREGAGPECGIRAKARAEKRAAKDAAMRAFTEAAAMNARPR
jgi:hypothetical protein